MPIKSIPNPPSLSEKIKSRRLELSLTIEEAAKRAGVGTKTWCRYEAGESIRADKYKDLLYTYEYAMINQAFSALSGD